MYRISQKSENCNDKKIKKGVFFLKSYEKAIRDEKYKKMNFYLFLLIIIDYLLTYIGVNNLEVVYEANPLMVWFFELPFFQGFLIRVIYAGFIIILSYFLYKNEYENYDVFMKFALGVNIFVLMIHFRWVLKYFLEFIS